MVTPVAGVDRASCGGPQMSAPNCPDDSAVDQIDQELRSLAKSLGVDPDAPDVVVQFAAALLLATLRILTDGQPRSPAKSRRKPTCGPGSTPKCTGMLIK